MSTLSDKSNSPVVSGEWHRAMLGFLRLQQKYGEEGVKRLKKNVNELNVMHNYKCPAAIASGKDYDTACLELDLMNIHARADYGFVHYPGEAPTHTLTRAWKEFLQAL